MPDSPNDIMFSEPQQAQSDVIPQQAQAEAVPHAAPLMPADEPQAAPQRATVQDATAQTQAPQSMAPAQPESAAEPPRAVPAPELVKVPELRDSQIKPADYLPETKRALDEHIRQLEHPLNRLTPVEPPKEIKSEKTWIDHYVKPIGQFGKGFIGGNIDIADTINALAQTPGKLGAAEGSQPLEDFGQKYEKNFGGEDVNTPAYQTGKVFGQLGTYGATSLGVGAAAAAAGVPLAGAGALGLLSAGAEGALQGAGQEAREQLRKTGRVSDLGNFAGSTALGAGLGLAGGAAANVIKGAVSRYATGKAAKEFGKLHEAANDLFEDAIKAAKSGQAAGKAAVEQMRKIAEAIETEALNHEIEGVNFVANTFNKVQPPENAFQQAQHAAMAEEAKAPFRLRKRNKGFVNIEHALELDEIAQHLPKDLHDRYVNAVQVMGQAKAAMMHLQNEVAATAENALSHAKDAAQLAKVVVEKSTRLRSDAAAIVAERRAELYLKERTAQISKLDAALQKEALDHIEDIPMDKYLYGIANRSDENFKFPGRLADNFDEAYSQFVQFSDALKAAEKQYKKLAKHFLPTFEEAERAFQESTGDMSRLFGKIKITNPFSESSAAWREFGHLTNEELDKKIARVTALSKGRRSAADALPWFGGGNASRARKFERVLERLSKEVETRQIENKGFAGKSDEDLMDLLDSAKTPKEEHAIALEVLRRGGADPGAFAKSTDFAIGLQFKPFVPRMSKAIAAEIEQLTQHLMAQEDNVATEIAYKVGGIESLTKQTGASAVKTLRELGVLHPVAERLALAAAFGITALDTPAEAFDGSPKDQKHFFAQVGTAAVAAILGAKYGVPAAQRLIRTKAWYYSRFLANTRELAAFADTVLGINAIAHPDASLAHNIQALAGKVINAVFLAPDDHVYLLRALHSDVDPKLLSPLGQQLVKEIRDEAKAFQSFVSAYDRAWKKLYHSFPEAKQEQLEHVHAAVDFVANNFGKPPRVRAFYDKAATNLFGNAARAWFTLNPKIWIGSVADLAITGPLQVGPGAMAAAAKMRLTNPLINGLLNKIELGGIRSQGIQNVAQKSTVVSAEAIQNRTMALASLVHYFETHPREMRAEGIKTADEFARKALSGQLSEEINADTFVQLAADLAETIGTDPLQLTKGALGRSMFGKFIQFTSQPERYARLMALRITTNPKWVVASTAMMHQTAGQSIVPVSAKLIGLAFAPEATQQLMGFLNMTSTGQHVLGPMNNMIDWDPFLYPAMGVEAPGLSQMLEIIGDWPSTSAAIGEVMYQASQGGGRFVGDPRIEANDKAQKAMHKLLMELQLAKPMIGPIPTRVVSNFLYYGPAAYHGVARVNVPAPLHIGDTRPTKPSEVKKFAGAREQSLRAMFNLPDTYDVGQYKTTNAIPHSKGTKLK